jgi:hypothetical protein
MKVMQHYDWAANFKAQMSLGKTRRGSCTKIFRQVSGVCNCWIVGVKGFIDGPEIINITQKHVEEYVIDFVGLSILQCKNATILKVIIAMCKADVRICAANQSFEVISGTAQILWNHDIIIFII